MARETERRLVAVLAADAVGFSRLVGVDEEGTVRRLQGVLAAIDALVRRHGGATVDTAGDGILAQFPSAVRAVECALAIQADMTRHNADLPSSERLLFRIGINVGDVMVEDGRVYGDGVNLAARLEPIAAPGGIAVSKSVRDQIRGKIPVALRSAGMRSLKNMAEPVEVFEVGEAAASSGPAGRLRDFMRRRGRLLGSGAAVLAAAGIVAVVLLRGSIGEVEARPAIAVLPFRNLSQAAAQDYFSDGLTENVLVALSRFQTLRVVGRNSAFSYRQSDKSVQQIAQELGIRYIVLGSVQKAGDRLRVSAQLINSGSGTQVWAEHFDRPMADIFAVQDEITSTIAARLGTSIQGAEVASGLRKAQTDLTAYDLYLRGRSLRQTGDKADGLQAHDLLKRAVEIDPSYAPALAELAFSYYRVVALRWDPANRDANVAAGIDLASRALRLDPTLPLAHMAMGDLLLRRHSYDEAIGWAKKAVALNPNDAEYSAALANILSFAGRASEAVALMERAIELDPVHPAYFDFYSGRALLLSGRTADAVKPLQECTRRAPQFWPCHLFLASTYGQLGESGPASAELEAVRHNSPIRTLADFGDDYMAGAERDRMMDGLAKAGLPAPKG